MNSHTISLKKFLILTAVGTIVYFAFGWFIFDVILGAYTEQNTTQLPGFKKTSDQFSMPYLVLSCAALITYVVAVLTNTTRGIKGLIIGATIGVLVAIMADAYWLASSNFYNNIAVAAADVLGAAVSVGVLGWVIALLSGRIK